MSNISRYVYHHLQIIAKVYLHTLKTKSILQKLGKVKGIPEESVQVTSDVKSLYTNIRNNNSIKVVKESY